MATTTEPRRAGASRPARRIAQAAFALLALVATTWAIVTFTRDDDVPVDPTTPQARRAATVAQTIVPGRVVGVARDSDNGKWEITIAQGDREYEVELAARGLDLLRLDYD